MEFSSAPDAVGDEAGRTRRRLAASGALLGFLICCGAIELGLGELFPLRWIELMLLAAVVGGLVGITRARRLLWVAAAALGTGILVVACTPVVRPLVQGLRREDPLAPSDAVVVLSTGIWSDGKLTAGAQARLVHGYEVLGMGDAPLLLVTRLKPPRPSYLPTVRRQMALLGLKHPVEETGVARDTHDEAVETAKLFRARHWTRVILVTDPTHMRRAAAVFRKAGVNVLCSPCAAVDFDLNTVADPDDRIKAFGHWLHEVVGFTTYRLRGWI